MEATVINEATLIPVTLVAMIVCGVVYAIRLEGRINMNKGAIDNNAADAHSKYERLEMDVRTTQERVERVDNRINGVTERLVRIETQIESVDKEVKTVSGKMDNMITLMTSNHK